MDSWVTHLSTFVLGVISTLTVKPLIGKIRHENRSTKVNQSGAKAGGDIVGRDKKG